VEESQDLDFLTNPSRRPARRGGGRTWAHFEFTRLNIAPTILRKKIEDLREVGAPVSIASGTSGGAAANGDVHMLTANSFEL
jgi:hypothetical protein